MGPRRAPDAPRSCWVELAERSPRREKVPEATDLPDVLPADGRTTRGPVACDDAWAFTPAEEMRGMRAGLERRWVEIPGEVLTERPRGSRGGIPDGPAVTPRPQLPLGSPPIRPVPQR